MIRALLVKEWREHRLVLALYMAAMDFVLLVQSWADKSVATAGSAFELVHLQCWLAMTLGALFVSHRLIVREYGQKTQLFLETLPVTRARLLMFKLALGAAVLLLPVALAFALAANAASAHEALTRRYLGLVAARSVLPVLAGWSLLALAGLVGRYRNPLLLFLFVGLAVLDTATSFEMGKLRSLLLLGEDFAYARTQLPWKGVLFCGALTAVFLALSFAIVLYRDGTVAELLSDRMSHREKVFVTCALLGLFYLGSLYGHAKQKDPFKLNDGTSTSERGVTVQVAPTQDFPKERASDLGQRAARDVAELVGYLGLDKAPSVALLPSRELDADVFERAELTDRDGLVLRGNFGAEGFDEARFRAFLARELVTWASNGHALREERRWLRDGFAALWADREGADVERLELRAAYAASRFSPERAPDWFSVEEELGTCLADAVAWLGARTLRGRLGDDGFASLIRATLGGRPPKGLWGLARTGSLASALKERGVPWSDFTRSWAAALEDARRRHAAQFAELARPTATLSLERDSELTFSVRHALDVAPPFEPPASRAFLAKRLDAFDPEVSPRELERFVAYTPAPARAPRSFSRGERWLWVLEVPEPKLGCSVRVLSERREVQ